MRDFLELGTTPYGEDCAQVGSDNYRENARKEANRYIAMLEKRFPFKPEKCQYGIKWNPHDFGSYAEVVIHFDDQDEMSQAYAFHVENNLPETWDDDEAFPFIEDYE